MRILKKVSSYAMVGGLGAVLVVGLVGCEKRENAQESNTLQEAAKKQGAFVVIEHNKDGSYRIVEEYPSSTTRVILRESNGSERILSKEELDKLVAEASQKVENNQSALVNPQIHAGMSLGEVILASAAGAIIGSWLGNKLFNNSTYQHQRRTTFKNPTAYERSVKNFQTKPPQKVSPLKSGFFKPTTTKKSTGFRSFSFGG